jgi:L-fucose isomerase-like protein
MTEMSVKLGVAVVSEEFAKAGYVKKKAAEVDSLVDSLGVECVKYNDVVSTRAVSKKAGRFFREHGADAILLYLATYSQDNLLIDIVYPHEGEIALWSAEEPLAYPYPDIGAYCGLTQVGGILSKLEKKYVLIDGETDRGINRKKLQEFVRAVSLKKKLMYSMIGMIGSRSDGMVENAFNELELRRQVGPEVVHIPLHWFFQKLKAASDERAKSQIPELFGKEDISRIPQDIVTESVKIHLVLQELVEELDLDGLTIKCWPELKENNVCSPCFALSKLHDRGITTTCEADVTALVSMMIGDALSESASFLSDLLKIDEENRHVYYFHCGAASTRLCGEGCRVTYDAHPFVDAWKPGIIVKFPVSPGRVVFARLGERNGKYRMVAYTGESVQTDEFVKGNTLKVRTDEDPALVVEKLVEQGVQHHQIMFFSDNIGMLRSFCRFRDIELNAI